MAAKKNLKKIKLSKFKIFSGLSLLLVLGLTVIGIQNRLSTSGKASSGCVIVQTDQGPGCWCSGGGWQFHCGVSKGEPAPDQCINDCEARNTDTPPDQKFTCVENTNNNGRDFGSPCSKNFQFACGGDGVKTECINGTWHDTGKCCPKGQVGDVVNCRKITSKDSCVGQCDWYACANGCYRRGTDKDTLCPRSTPTPKTKPTPTPTSKETLTSTPSPSPRISLTPIPSNAVRPSSTPIPTSTPVKSLTPTLTLSPTPVSVATGCEISITLDGPISGATFHQNDQINLGFSAFVGWRFGKCGGEYGALYVDNAFAARDDPLLSDTINVNYKSRYDAGLHSWQVLVVNKYYEITSETRWFTIIKQ